MVTRLLYVTLGKGWKEASTDFLGGKILLNWSYCNEMNVGHFKLFQMLIVYLKVFTQLKQQDENPRWSELKDKQDVKSQFWIFYNCSKVLPSPDPTFLTWVMKRCNCCLSSQCRLSYSYFKTFKNLDARKHQSLLGSVSVLIEHKHINKKSQFS